MESTKSADSKPKGRRYTEDIKRHALSLYFSGPKTYKKMISTYKLPSVTTLKRITRKIQQRPGFNEFIFRSLQKALVNKSEADRMCIVAMDEMALKANLQYNVRTDEIIGFHDLGKFY